MDTDSPVLVITGASSGIGAATGRLAADRGWRVVLAARNGGSLDALAAELGGPAVAKRTYAIKHPKRHPDSRRCPPV